MPADQRYTFTPLFDDRRETVVERALRPEAAEVIADRTPSDWYVFDDAIRLRINLALATGRPLLVRGPSGSGKSSLARAVAARAKWNYKSGLVGSRTQAQDLLYEVDHIRRLQDAHANKLSTDERAYIRPGPLFWGFDADTAHELTRMLGNAKPDEAAPAYTNAPWVVLIDEIDKADPDVPNNLLVPLGTLEFPVAELGVVVKAKPGSLPLVIVTTNEERELPPAFLRRCVELVIGEPDCERLEQVAKEHRLDQGLDLAMLAERYMQAQRPRDQPRNVAEFLDFVRAWRELELVGDETTSMAVLEAITGRVSR